MNRSITGQALRGLALFFAGCGLAQASSFSVNPVRVTLSAKQPVAAITVRNSSAEPTVVQLETTAWSQEQGKDALMPSSDLLATPPIFTVPAGGTQIVRVGLRGARASSAEVTYRLILREVPPTKPQLQGLRVTLNVSMPVFVLPATPVAPELKWRATRAADGKVNLSATNGGNAHVQLGKVEIAAGGAAIGGRDIAEYVLPGNTRYWTVDASKIPAAGAKLHISATSDAGVFESDIPLEAEATAIATASTAAAPVGRAAP
jgi:fimbrial chaperone protein